MSDDVKFALSAEQEELQRTVRRFLEAKAPVSESRRLMTTERGYDSGVWKQMAGELGLQGLHIPEEFGGQGFTFVELGVVLEEMGRTLLASPFFSSVCLAANAILNAGTDEQRKEYLPGIASGETIATLAVAEPGRGWMPGDVEMEATAGSRLSGTKTLVTDGHVANLLVVAARGPGGVGLYVVEGDAAGLKRELLKSVDMTRKLARLELDGVAATRLGDGGAEALDRTLDQAKICLGAEMTGGAQACLDMARRYALDRYQFGKPIGAFQAIKHQLADVLLQVESARTLSLYGLWAASTHEQETPVVAAMSKFVCADAFWFAATENHQIHGGIGFTFEHDAHLYYRRAKSCDILFGDSTLHRELLAQRLGI